MLELNKLYLMDCMEGMKLISDNTIDACVTDPPYELGFMGKKWDSTGIAYDIELWKECFRILKPGAYLLAFGGSRTYHRLACAIEDAGFEIRDQIMWVYGSGFPKSLDIGKAVDKLQGNEREKIPNNRHGGGSSDIFPERNNFLTTKGTSEWEGWGTALKPAHEPIVVARKPLEGTVAENVLKWGTGGMNIDECRIGHNEEQKLTNRKQKSTGTWNMDNCGFDQEKNHIASANEKGRFPANFIHDGSEEVVRLFPASKSTGGRIGNKDGIYGKLGLTGFTKEYSKGDPGFGDSGSAARFFYCAKASRSERNEGCEGLDSRTAGEMTDRKDGSLGLGSPSPSPGRTSGGKNFHPTVKPIALMEYLIKLVSREDALILDPFLGSGTTGIACRNLNRRFIGFEKDVDYYEIATKRIEQHKEQLVLEL